MSRTPPRTPEADPSLAALAEALQPALLRVSRRMRREAQGVGVSPLDALLLGQIQRSPGIGICELAEAEGLSRPTMSGHLKRLVAAGWVEKASDLQDGRRAGLTLTPAGRHQLALVRRLRNDWLARRLITLDPEHRRRLSDAAQALSALGSAEP